jgi:hypothetical protein
MTVVDRFAVSLSILAPGGNAAHNLVRPNLHVVGLASAPVGFDLLIGMDILSECLLFVNGRDAHFTIAF